MEEELFFDFEQLQETKNKKLFLANVESLSWDVVSDKLNEVRSAVNDYDEEKIAEILKQIVELD